MIFARDKAVYLHHKLGSVIAFRQWANALAQSCCEVKFVCEEIHSYKGGSRGDEFGWLANLLFSNF